MQILYLIRADNTASLSTEATGKAATAALRQAIAAIAVDSPIPGILELKLVGYADESSSVSTVDPVLPGLPPEFCRPLVHLQNRGRTEMQLVRFCCDWVVSPSVPDMPQYHHVEIWNAAIPKESSVWCLSRNGMRLTKEERASMENLDAFLWVYGYFAYRNFMNDAFVIGYIARWDVGEGFVREPLTQYEYKRSDEDDKESVAGAT